MECKESIRRNFTRRLYRINRNIMECKVVDDGSRKSKVAVLIETLWNVKIDN